MTETTTDTQQKTTSLQLWPAAAIVATMWTVIKGTQWFAPGTMLQFMSGFFAPQACAALLVLWWLFASRAAWRERLVGLALIAGLLLAAFLLSHESMFVSLLMFTLPWLSTAIAGLLLLKFISWQKRRWLPVVAGQPHALSVL